MDEYEHLTDAQWDLFDRMSGISEDCYCAGWLHDIEYVIWRALAHGANSVAPLRMDARRLRRCQALSAELNGWIFWDDGPQFAPMAQWLEMVARHDARLQRNPDL